MLTAAVFTQDMDHFLKVSDIHQASRLTFKS